MLEEKLYARFKEVDSLPASITKTLESEMPSPDEVLRYIKAKGAKDGVLVPSTPAMAFVMR